MFEWIGASARHQRAGDDEQDRQAFHLLILESKPSIAIADIGTNRTGLTGFIGVD